MSEVFTQLKAFKNIFTMRVKPADSFKFGSEHEFSITNTKFNNCKSIDRGRIIATVSREGTMLANLETESSSHMNLEIVDKPFEFFNQHVVSLLFLHQLFVESETLNHWFSKLQENNFDLKIDDKFQWKISCNDVETTAPIKETFGGILSNKFTQVSFGLSIRGLCKLITKDSCEELGSSLNSIKEQLTKDMKNESVKTHIKNFHDYLPRIGSSEQQFHGLRQQDFSDLVKTHRGDLKVWQTFSGTSIPSTEITVNGKPERIIVVESRKEKNDINSMWNNCIKGTEKVIVCHLQILRFVIELI
jgi:hypothetical protein